MRRGEVVGERFVLERLLGEGGMGLVFLATDQLTASSVAVKLFPAATDDIRARFEREAEVLASLRHPAIVGYVAHGAPKEGPLYLAMEFLEGEDLLARLMRGPLSVEESLVVARRVLDALAEAHRHGVVHRDIKPGNLLLVGGSVHELKLIDFGIARVDSKSSLTQAGFTLGTPDYMAPEQARGDAVLLPAIDVFSVGCVLFECLTGRPPFVADDPLAVLTRILLEKAPRGSSVRPDIPEAVDELLAALLAKDLHDRPANGAEALALVDATMERVALGRSSGGFDDPTPSLTGREQQLLSLLFIARSDDGRSFDPVVVSAIVGPLGGRAEYLVDGTLLVTLRGRGAAAEQSVVAARCALALREALPGHRMALVTGRGELLASVPMGEVIDRGVALLASARPAGEGDAGGIPIDVTTADLVAATFELVQAGAGVELTRARPESGGHTLLGRYQPFVGRDAEAARLVGAFDAVLGAGSARVELVTGGQGIGKSRLRTEVTHRLGARDPPTLFLAARGDASRHGLPFALVASAIRYAFGIRDSEPLLQQQQKLRTHVAMALSLPPASRLSPEGERIAELLGELIGAPFSDVDRPFLRAARGDAVRLGDQMWRAWMALLDHTTRTRPVVISIDDVHLADVPSISFIDTALRNLHDRPILVVAFARPEVDAVFPVLWASRALTRTVLLPLSRDASTELVRTALGSSAPPDLVPRIVERGEGNPLYLEEIVRAASAGKADELPTTLLAMVETRLEPLSKDVRRVLRAASVFGRISWRSGIASLCGTAPSAIDGALVDLVKRELLSLRGVTFDGELEYAFQHALVRDVAYATLTDRDKTLGHDLAGRWLAEHRPGDVLAIAEHFDRGGQPAAALAWFDRSAEMALEGNDFGGAIARAERAMACGAEGIVLGRLLLLVSECRRHLGSNEEMLRTADEAREILVRGTPPWFRATANVVLGAIRLGRKHLLEGAMADLGHVLAARSEARFPASAARIAHYLHFAGHHDFATRLLSAAWSENDREGEGPRDDVGDRERAAWFHRACATRALVLGDLGSYVEHLERAVASFERAGDVREPASERVNLGFAKMELGLYREAEAVLRLAVGEVDALGLLHAGATARENLGAVLARQGAREEAEPLLRSAIETFSSQKNRRMEGNARAYLGVLLDRAGDSAGAERELRQSVELLATVKPLLPVALAALSRVLLGSGRIDEARRTAERASEALAAVGHPDEGEALVRLTEAETLLACGERDQARKAIVSARDRLLERAGRIREPSWREAFLAVEENRQTLVLSEELEDPETSG